MTPQHLLLLTTTFGQEESIVDVFAFERGELLDINFKYHVQESNIIWHIRKGPPHCSIENIQSLKEEFFSKSEVYSQSKDVVRLYNFQSLPLVPGKYHPRIYRPQFIRHEEQFMTSSHRNDALELMNYLPNDFVSMMSGITQLSLLTDELKNICRTIAPDHRNFAVFGHELRNLLILACTEIEAQLRGIYEANMTKRPKGNLNIQKYFLLNKHLKLNQYVVIYRLYPWLDNFNPFKYWADKSFASLPWYAAYNEVKHDRENKMELATLENVLEAIVALAVVLQAQYGDRIPFWKDLIGQFFKFSSRPSWDLSEWYLPPFENDRWFAEQCL